MEDLTIRTASLDEFEDVINFYYDLIDSMQDAGSRPDWKKDVYPTRQFIYDSISKKNLYIAIINSSIAGSMVMNHVCSDAYSEVKWNVPADHNEIMIIHALAVSQNVQGKGIAKKIMEYSIDFCENNGIKAIRLDVLPSNKSACKFYEKMNFVYIGKVQLFYEDTGLTDFLLYELEISRSKPLT